MRIFVEGAQAPKTSPNATERSPQSVPAANLDESVQTLLKQVEDWVLKVTAATAAGGVGLTLVVVLGVSWWRRRWLNRLALREQEWAQQKERLALLTSERQRVESELRTIRLQIDKRVEERTAKYARLEAELNERKQTEKALAHQAQELGRSKDVLEMHVQSRTLELQKLQRRYEHILNSAGEGIYGLDLQGKTTFVNPAAAKITGWKVEELVGKLEQEIFHHTPAEAPGSDAQAREPNGEHLTDKIFFRKDGTTFVAEYVRTPILEKEKPVGAVVIFKDITERKRTEETLARKAAELARSNSELEQFAYVASHDLQEPLRKIQAFGDRLKAKVESAHLQDGHDYLERMQSAAARMQRLINDLLSFSRVISATQPFVPVNLAAVTKEVLTDLEVRIEQTKAKVEVGDLPTIEADPMQMRQLVQNLIGNGLKFQAPNSQPVVKVHAKIVTKPFAGGESSVDDKVCELTIQDNGIGFDEKYLDKIFAMFQRLHGRTEYEGTGVGLAICRRITDRHSGTIKAKSKPGEGATFIITLPVRQTKAEKAP
jgi:PAS domain S-box-containing protein